jgi:CheY-like chemotaxis protein
MAASTILWAEDSEDDVLLMERAFRRAQLPSCWIRVRDGDEATKYLSGSGCYADRARYPLPQLLLLDIKMPRLSGLEVLKWKADQPELRSMAAVVLSSSEDSRDKEEAYGLGAKEFIVKSVRVDDWVQQLRELHSRWIDSRSEAT